MNERLIQFRRMATVIALLLAGGTAGAQQLPNVGDAMRQSAPPPQPAMQPPALPTIGGGNHAIEPPMAALPSGPKLDVKAIEVVGNRVIATATLAPLVAKGAGKSLSLGELEALAQQITKYYRARGYFVARAYVPAQEITSGIVKIRVVEGNYGEFHLQNRSRVRDSIVQGMLNDVKGADIVSVDTLERAMLIINDTPGVQVTRADVMPGERVGTSDFAVDTVAKAPYAGYLMLDNYGSTYTGKDRLSFNLDANSPTGSGDRLSLSGLATEHGDLLNGRVGYSAPLASNGLRAEIAVSQTAYRLSDVYAPLDATGHATGVDAILSYPIRRIEAQTVSASLDLAYKSLIDDIALTDTRNPRDTLAATMALTLRDTRALLGSDGTTQATGAITVGHLKLKDATSAALDSAGADTAGDYHKFDLNLNRVSLLPAQFAITTSLSGQYAFDRKTLDGTERMAVSGTSAVAAYPPDELIGDSALIVHIDLDRQLPTLAEFHSDCLLFVDYGEAWTDYANPSEPSRRDIDDIGLGLNGTYRGLVLHANLAHRMHVERPVSEPEPRTKLLIQAGWVF